MKKTEEKLRQAEDERFKLQMNLTSKSNEYEMKISFEKQSLPRDMKKWFG